MNSKFLKLNNQEGIALLLTMLILAGILAITIGIANLMITEIRLSSLTGQSVTAYYAAESGIEKALYEDRKGSYDPPAPPSGPTTLYTSTDPAYNVSVTTEEDSETPGNMIVTYKSIGSYKKTNRSIEVDYSTTIGEPPPGP